MTNSIKKRRGKKGLYLASLGLFIGLLIGFGIKAIENYAASELISILEEEAKKACDCTFEADQAKVGLFSLKGRVKNAKLLKDGKVYLQFNQITAKFSLSDYKKKIIRLTDLHLIDGLATNVDEDSVTYKFIDSLSTPLPPEQVKEDSWKLRLEALRVSTSSFIQDYISSQLTGDRISLTMNRDANDDFVLKPVIGKLNLLIKDPLNQSKFSKTIKFGKVKSILTIQDAKTIFKKIRLVRKKSVVKAIAESLNKQGNKLSGNIDYKLQSEFLQLDSFLNGSIYGQGELAGSLGQPEIFGKLSVNKSEPINIHFDQIPLFSIDYLKANYNYALKDNIHNLKIDELLAKSANVSVTQSTPIVIKDEEISGELKIQLDSLEFGELELFNINVDLNLSQTLGELGIDAIAEVEKAKLGNLSIPHLTLNYSHSNNHSLQIEHNSYEYGSIVVNTEFDPASKTVTDQIFDCKLNNFSLILPKSNKSAEEEFAPDTIRLTGEFKLRGVNDLSKLTGDGNLSIDSNFFSGESALNSKINIEKGFLKAEVYNLTKTLVASTQLYLGDFSKQNNLKIKLANFKPTEYSPAASCVSATAELEYNFSLEQANMGKGYLNFKDLILGCQPYVAKLAKPQNLTIKDGQAYLTNFNILSSSTNLIINGQAGWNKLGLKINGDLLLNSVLGFFPYLDDMVGKINTDLELTGEVGNPRLSGIASVEKAEVSSESLDIEATDITGKFLLKETNVEILSLSSALNGGKLLVSGKLDLLNFVHSKLKLNFQHVAIDSVADTSILLSGDMEVKQTDKGKTILQGDVIIDELEILKEFKPINLVTDLISNLMPTSNKSNAQSSNKSSDIIEIAINLKAPRNILIYSNFLTAELSADLQLLGSVDNPQIIGQLKTISGWLGLKNKRFEITSGGITFKGASSTPELDILGETSVFSRTGEFVTIIMEARGSLLNPKILLSSDAGFSQSELLSLLTGNIRPIESTRANRYRNELNSGALEFFSSEDDNLWTNILNRLTTIDDIAIEPALNIRSGSVEPVLAATKNLTSRFMLTGETFLGPEGYSRIRGRFDLLPKVSLVGSIDSLTTENNSSFGFDFIYTAIAKRKAFIEFDITGNKNLSNDEVLSAIKLTEDSRLKSSDLPNLINFLQFKYVDLGIFNSSIDMNCIEENGFCRKLIINISESNLNKINDALLEGDKLPFNYTIPSLRGEVATKVLLETERKKILNQLRSEGYISARILASYEPYDVGIVNLVFDISVGQQQSFLFDGNRLFTAEDFLNTINLFNRKQPFGRNTINILLENIERLYRESGYLYVTIDHQKSEDTASNKITHKISINEENQVKIDKVELTGNSIVSTDRITTLLKTYYPSVADSLFTASFYIAEDVSENIKVLSDILKRAGLVGSKVKHKITDVDKDRIVLTYEIHEGEVFLFDNLVVNGWPQNLTKSTGTTPKSIPEINELIKDLKEELNSLGYISADLYTSIDQATGKLTINVNAKNPTTIQKIEIEGLKSVDQATVIDKLPFREDSTWDREQINLARTNLLTLNLFSKIEIIAKDGSLDSEKETILIRLEERPLTTLEFGGGINSQLGVHFFGEAIDRSLFLDGRTISLRADAYIDQVNSDISQGITSLRYSQPTLFDEPVKLTQDLRFQKAELSTLEYDIDRLVSDTSLYKRFNEYLMTSMSYIISQDSLTNVTEDAILSDLDTGTVNIGLINLSLRWDWRDNPVNPNQGYTFSLNPALASDYMGSDANFYSINTRFSGVHPIARSPFSVAHNTRLGSSWGYDDTEVIPITQRYYLGGRQSVRGFRENSLGPRGDEGAVLGGDFLFSNNFELRYLVRENFSTHTFFDIGNVYLQDRSIDLEDLRQSIGLGLRYLSPIGPIGFDLGHPIDEKAGEPSVRLHFSIGSSF
jgi:outer membrane protein insertion porin family